MSSELRAIGSGVPECSKFQGDVRVRQVHEPVAPTPLAEGDERIDMDLSAMARWAMHYLAHNPESARGHECRFDLKPLDLPPLYGPDRFDFISIGDTENRMDCQWLFMRRMTGEMDYGCNVEQAVRDRLFGYVRDDGLSWCPPYAADCTDEDAEDGACPWATANTLVTCVELFRQSGDEMYLSQAGRLVRGLKSLASWDRGRAWYPAGGVIWRNGEWVTKIASAHYPMIIDQIVRYCEVATDDAEALDFAIAWVEGAIARLQVSTRNNHFRPDGSYTYIHNTHIHMRGVLGALRLGVLIGEPRYIEWGRNAYRSTMNVSTDWGWVPESIGRDFSETCAVGDMVEAAMHLARAGYHEYWDHVERFVRNYIREAQFFVTPEFEALYRRIHKERSAGEVEFGLAQAQRLEGGIHSVLTPNDWVAHGPHLNGMNMMGCCPPEGMRALYAAWDSTVTEDEFAVWVNLSFTRDTPQAKVVSYLPHQGRLTVTAKKDGYFMIRVPAWVDRRKIRTWRNGREEPLWFGFWAGDYVQFPDAKAGEELTVVYPLPEFDQTVELHPAGRFAYRWLGNTVVDVSPRGEHLPIFTDVPRPLPEYRECAHAIR